MKKTIRDFNLENKKVIIRADYNVPINNGVISDDNRIVESLETIKYALNKNAKVILLSHLGRIKTKADLEKNNLEVVSKRLSELLGKEVIFINDLDFNKIKAKIEKSDGNNVFLLQNTRYYDLDEKKESTNDSNLAKMYASLGDIFINDAFGTVHRSHASNVGVANYLPSGIGFLVEKELKELEYLNKPDRKYTVILGGSKVSDKIKVIEELIRKCDHLIIGGAMVFTFLKAKGYNIGKSLVEDDYIDFCKDMISRYQNKILLPTDIVVSKEISDKEYVNKKIDCFDEDDIGLDLGTDTISSIKEMLKDTKTVFWNGPLGYYELDVYLKSSKEILEYLVENNIKTILGGGDIVACASILGLKEKVAFISTGGGATLEYLEGEKLPGLEVIQDKE